MKLKSKLVALGAAGLLAFGAPTVAEDLDRVGR
jgi:hypothetical protein